MSRQTNTVTVDVLSMRMDQKLKYLATVAARYRGQTLSAFIETAVKQALSPEAMGRDEPSPGTEIVRNSEPLWSENLWCENEAERVFRLAVSFPDLLSGREQAAWGAACQKLAVAGRKVSLRNFKEVYTEVE